VPFRTIRARAGRKRPATACTMRVLPAPERPKSAVTPASASNAVSSVKSPSGWVRSTARLIGPPPAPLLPRWETFEWEGGWSDIGIVELPCNWLQCMENSLDPVHLEWLPGYWGVRQQQDKAVKLGLAEADSFPTVPRRHQKIGFDLFDYGLIKRRVVEGTTEDDHDWAVGHPVLFPNILFVGSVVNCTLQYRVPVDDEHTMHITWFFYRAAEGAAPGGQSKTVTAGGVENHGGANPLSGYSICEAADMDKALGIAKGCPILAAGGTVEVAEARQM